MSEGVLPFPLRWQVQPPSPPELAASSLSFEAGPRTDLFADPAGEAPRANAPLALGDPSGDFQLAARVSATLGSTFDAAALVVWAGPSTWAKLALERSPQGEPTVVTVVTRGVSDDANAFVMPQESAWLRVARIGETYAFHASLDTRRWWLARYFTLDAAGRASVGFLVQSPTGDGTRGRFAEIDWRAETLRDVRDGS